MSDAHQFVSPRPLPYNGPLVSNPRRITQLPVTLVNRIAAGEVIERPASVVKELVENAIDAGAASITIEIADGGRELIRVIDDGGGIPIDDLPLAFAEHATSKLTCDADLFAIETMGFRGEALASIGSVSQARILTRTADSDTAWEIANRAGTVSAPQASAGNVGTSVEVRNLFFNVPARRKFLRGASTETGHISDIAQRLALPHPHIAFKLISNGRTNLDLPAGTLEERLLSAWPDHFREQRLPVVLRDAEIRIDGLIGLPELATPTVKHQYFYLNGRHIRDRFLQHALREAYRGLTEPGRQPAAILLLTMPPSDVDVNVHPTKAEVRFKDSGRVHGLVLGGLREKLLGSDLTPLASPRAGDAGTFRQDMRDRLASFLRSEADTAPAASMPVSAAAPALLGNVGPISPNTQAALPAQFAAPNRQLHTTPSPAAADAAPGTGLSDSSANFANLSRQSPGQSGSALQLHNSYLVAQTEDGMVIIDQHALHERIMYEELLARISRGPLEAQRLLLPIAVEASARQMALVEQIQPLLMRLGIELSAFGPTSVAIHAFPTFLQKLDPERFILDLLERGEAELLDLHTEEMLHDLLDMMACKAAVKAGDPLTPGEIEALLARRELIDRASNCPHGRPTTLRLTLKDLEKQFKRTGF